MLAHSSLWNFVLLLCSPLSNIDGRISLYDFVFWFTNVNLITNFIHGDGQNQQISRTVCEINLDFLPPFPGTAFIKYGVVCLWAALCCYWWSGLLLTSSFWFLFFLAFPAFLWAGNVEPTYAPWTLSTDRTAHQRTCGLVPVVSLNLKFNKKRWGRPIDPGAQTCPHEAKQSWAKPVFQASPRNAWKSVPGGGGPKRVPFFRHRWPPEAAALVAAMPWGGCSWCVPQGLQHHTGTPLKCSGFCSFRTHAMKKNGLVMFQGFPKNIHFTLWDLFSPKCYAQYAFGRKS